ncbi:MAG: DUF4153 domain-containing protein [Acidaminococcaceae bacterium]
MNSFARSIMQIAQGAGKAFTNFPTAIACAAAFTAVTMVRIYLDWPQQKDYVFLFNCLHWSLGFGAIFSTTAITAVQSRYNDKQAFVLANMVGIIAAVIAFGSLFIWGGRAPEVGQISTNVLSDLAEMRIVVAMFVSFLAFLIFAGSPKEEPDLAKSLFMTHKAFFISTIYGFVLWGGTSSVAAAIQALLYQGMSYNVYAYIAALIGFFTFTIYLGYFPDFRDTERSERRLVAEHQPRFIEILFGYIMVPIMLALTVVLLLWAVRIVTEGVWPSFMRLSGIAASYATSGIWLHMMLTDHEGKMSVFYRKYYPFAALVILGFEAWALVVQLGKYGLKTTEYYFGLTWIFAVVSVILLVLFRAAAHRKIIVLTAILAICSVLPAIGYNVLPIKAQTTRLEKMLVSQNMLIDGKLVPASSEPSEKIREGITDAVNFLAYSTDVKLPVWFEKNFANGEVFKSKFGFKQTWPKDDNFYGTMNRVYLNTSLYLSATPMDIKGYDWVLKPQKFQEQGLPWGEIKGSKGTYKLTWTTNKQDGTPSLKVTMDGRLLLEESFKDYITKIEAAYPPVDSKSHAAGLSDMSVQLQTPEIKLMVVFGEVHINLNNRENKTNYNLNLDAIYLREK